MEMLVKLRRVVSWDRLPEASRLGKIENPPIFEGNAFAQTNLLRISKSSVEGQPFETTKVAAARGAFCLSGDGLTVIYHVKNSVK